MQINKGNEILNIQHQLLAINEVQLGNTKAAVHQSITARHTEAANIMLESMKNIEANSTENKDNNLALSEIDTLLANLKED